MKSFTPTPGASTPRAFLASLLTCIILVTPLTPIGYASTNASRLVQTRAKSADKQQPAPKADAQTREAAQRKQPPVASAITASDITATKTDVIVSDALGDGKAQAGDTIKYTVTVRNNSATDTASNVVLNDPIDPNTTIVADSIHAQPQARDDAYTTVGNTLLEVGVPAGTAPAVHVTGSAFDNDGNPTDPSSLASHTQPANGTVTFNADGTFTYLPNAGFTGPTDTFTYTLRNNADNTLTDTATITINISGRVWYVNNAVANGDGRSTSPFNSLTPVNGAGGAGDSDAANDFIYLFQGSGAYTTGITLENGQQLIGNGVDLVVATHTLRTGSLAQRPTISNGAGNIITLAQNNTVRGLNTGDSSGVDIIGTSFGTLTADNIAIGGTGRPLSLTTGTLAATFDQISSTNSSGGQGILLQTGVAGSMVVTNGTTIAGPTTQGILVTQSTANINFGNTSVTGGTDGISLSNNSAGTRTFGTLTRTGGTGVGFLHSVGGGITNITGLTTISGTGGRGIDIEDSAAAVTFSNVSVGTTGGTGVFLEDNSGAITFADLDVTPNANQKAVTVNNCTGAVTATSGDLSATGNSVLEITGPAGRTPLALSLTSLASTNNANAGGFGLNVNLASGTLTVTGATNIQNPAGIGIQLQNSTAAFNFQGATTSNASGGTAIFLNLNSGAITFPTSGTFTISPDSGQRGLHATANTGAITCGTGTVATTNATGIDIVGTSAASRTPLNMQFVSVNVTGGNTAPNGIVLGNTSSTGSPGGFRVNGNGGTCTFANPAACTGGRITATTGADAGGTPAATTQYGGIGVRLHDAANVFLTRMRIDNHPNFPIRGVNVDGFSLDASVIDGVNGNSTGADVDAVANGEDAVRFSNLTGVAAISNSFIGGGHENIVRVINNTGTLNRLTISNSIIGDLDGAGAGFGNSVAGGDDGIVVSSTGTAILNVTLSNNTLNQAKGDVVQIATNQASTMDLVMRGNSISNNHTNIVSGVGGVTIGATSGAGQTATLTYDVSCNKFRDSKGNGVTLFKGVGGTSNMNGTFFNNRIGVTGVANSGAANGANGLQVDANGVGTHTILVKNNIIFRYGAAGIGMNANDGSSILNATVIGNTTSEPDSFGFAGFFAEVGAIPASDTNRINLKLGGAGAEQNNFVNGDPANGSDVLYSKIGAGTQFNLSRGVSAANDAVTITQQNNVTPITVVAAPGMTFVNTVPALPAAINESCAPPAINFEADGNDSASPIAVSAPVKTDAVAQQPAATTNNVINQPFVSLPQQQQQQQVAPAQTALKVKAGMTKETARETSQAKTPAIQPMASAFPVNIGTLLPGESITITFSVKIADVLDPSVTQISNQGQITSSSFAGTVLTDDPDAAGANNPTVTPVLGLPTISINNASTAEPTSGTAPMPFTVTLSHAYGSAVAVNYQTADGTATAGTDYTAASGTLNFTPGQTFQTISVDVLADADAGETDETFTVTLNTPTNGILSGTPTATGTITTANPPGTVLISELRTSGPGGPNDDFVELYNNTDAIIDIGNFALVKSGSTCTAAPIVVAVIPAGTMLPARGHYLIAGSAYSLTTTAVPDQTLLATDDIEDDRNLALFDVATPAGFSTTTRRDAVGFAGNTAGNCGLLLEGTPLPATGGSTSEYSFARNLISGLPKETNNNTADFILVSTTPAVPVGSNTTPILGAPGTENLASPVQRNAVIKSSLIDPMLPSVAPPNRVRSSFGANPTNAAFGTLSIQRRFKNTLSVPVTRLRFRIVDLTTINNRTPGQADLRVLSSTGVVTDSAGNPVVTVNGLTLEAPTQPNGGGLNSSLTVVLPGGGLAPGSTIDVQFLLGVQEQGSFSFFVNVEALPGSGTVADEATGAMKARTTGKQRNVNTGGAAAAEKQ